MTVAHGNSGIVKSGANSVAEVQSWSYEESDVAVVELTSMGDAAASYLASGCKRGSGSIECYLDEADTDGQLTLTPGASVTVALYPEGDASGKTEYTGTVIVETVSRSGPKDGPNAVTFSYQGALTRGTVV